MKVKLWENCLEYLQDQVPADKFNMWLKPLQAELSNNTLVLLAPNRFVLDWVSDKFFDYITEALNYLSDGEPPSVTMQIGEMQSSAAVKVSSPEGKTQRAPTCAKFEASAVSRSEPEVVYRSNLNSDYNFATFVEGKSNQLAKAAAMQVAESPGSAYNPLFIYGGVGLGKTHLMHGIGNLILKNKPDAKILYLNSERFVGDMVRALQNNIMNEFKRYYRSLDALLIDDIQFFSGKDRSQEEFFYTFNTLLEGDQQIVLTSDRYPKEISGVTERLKSRFGWGLTVAVEPPELETRVAILLSKAKCYGLELPYEVAFFIAKRIRSNVRELEGALKRVRANAHFSGKEVTLESTKEALRDLIALQDKLVTIDNIIKTVAEYYKVKVSDILSKRRTRSITRPRQMAMALAKELTNHSLPEIGEAFGGRDHTTVLHSHRKINELRGSSRDIEEDFVNLLRILTT